MSVTFDFFVLLCSLALSTLTAAVFICRRGNDSRRAVSLMLEAAAAAAATRDTAITEAFRLENLVREAANEAASAAATAASADAAAAEVNRGGWHVAKGKGRGKGRGAAQQQQSLAMAATAATSADNSEKGEERAALAAAAIAARAAANAAVATMAGWPTVVSVRGGLEAWARDVDGSFPFF